MIKEIEEINDIEINMYCYESVDKSVAPSGFKLKYLTVKISEDSELIALKEEAFKKTTLKPEEQLWNYYGGVMQFKGNDNQTLKSLGIKNGAHLTVQKIPEKAREEASSIEGKSHIISDSTSPDTSLSGARIDEVKIDKKTLMSKG